MRILLLNQFFHPDLAASAQIATDLAFDLAAAGHEVTAVAGRGVYAGEDRRRPLREEVRGVRIRRLPCTNFGRRALVGRLADYGGFLGTLFLSVPFLGRHDVVVAMSTPPMLSLSGLLARKLGRGRLVYWVQDVYPEIALELGALRPGLAADLLARFSRASLRGADRVVTIGEVMTSRVVAAGADPARIRVVENWADGAAIRREEEGTGELRKELGLEGRFVVLYSGNLGNAHDFSGLEAAVPRVLERRPDVAFVFVGEGAQKRRLVESFAGLGDRVRFLPYREREGLSDGLALGDLHLVTQRKGLEGLVVPSKFYGILAAGRPVLFLGPEGTEVGARLRRFELGNIVNPGDPESIAESIERWATLSIEVRRAAGEKARRTFEREYDRPRALKRFLEVLEELTAADSSAPGEGEEAGVR